MQPYLLPYVGYFQLMRSADTFIILDDVNFKKKSWINRNSILINRTSHTFTLPVEKASQNVKIRDLWLSQSDEWGERFRKSIAHAYRSAAYFEPVYNLLEDVFSTKSRNLAEFVTQSVLLVADYLKLETQVITSSSVYRNSHLRGEERIIDICRQAGATQYINSAGGRNLYDQKHFMDHGIELGFLSPRQISYQQFAERFIPNLSIVDTLMFNSREELELLLQEFDISWHGSI
jgi:hypothetical protein